MHTTVFCFLKEIPKPQIEIEEEEEETTLDSFFVVFLQPLLRSGSSAFNDGAVKYKKKPKMK